MTLSRADKVTAAVVAMCKQQLLHHKTRLVQHRVRQFHMDVHRLEATGNIPTGNPHYKNSVNVLPVANVPAESGFCMEQQMNGVDNEERKSSCQSPRTVQNRTCSCFAHAFLLAEWYTSSQVHKPVDFVYKDQELSMKWSMNPALRLHTGPVHSQRCAAVAGRRASRQSPTAIPTHSLHGSALSSGRVRSAHTNISPASNWPIVGVQEQPHRLDRPVGHEHRKSHTS